MRKFVSVLICILFLTGCAAPAPETVVSVRETPEAQEVFLTAEPQTTAPTEAPTVEPTEEPTPEPTPEPTEEPTPEPFRLYALPEGMRPRHDYETTGTAGLLYCAKTQTYAAYGAFGETEPAFYPSDERAAVEPDAEPLERVMLVPVYAPTDAPKKDGEKLLVVYLGSQSVAGFLARDGEWVELRVMICSTGRAKHETPKGSYKISDRYEYKVLGTGETHCYGFWACRFKKHYLFHSVPISYDAGRSKEKGHRMCDMHKYEKLGTPASDGCVRLTVADAKWVYDFSESGRVSVRVIGDSGPVPEKPPAVIWEEPYTDKNGLGWDPTDPNEDNPYLSGNA